jgi:hypothetical protein
MIPNEKIRAFVSMMPTQAGLSGALSTQITAPGGPMDNPDMPAAMVLAEKNLQCFFKHNEAISVVDGKVCVKVNVDVAITARGGLHGVAYALGIACDRTPASVREQVIGGGRYSVEMEVDLNQDMTGKDIPEFRLVNASREPLPVQPPAGQAASAA